MQTQSVVVMNGLMKANKFTGANDTCLHTARIRVVQHAVNLATNADLEEDGVLSDALLFYAARCNETVSCVLFAKEILLMFDGDDHSSPYNYKLINFIRKE